MAWIQRRLDETSCLGELCARRPARNRPVDRGLAPNGTHFDGASIDLLDIAGFFRFRKCEDLGRRG